MTITGCGVLLTNPLKGAQSPRAAQQGAVSSDDFDQVPALPKDGGQRLGQRKLSLMKMPELSEPLLWFIDILIKNTIYLYSYH